MPTLTERFQRLPTAQKALIGFGVPAAAGAALIGQLRSRSADEEPAAPLVGTQPIDVTPVALGDVTNLINTLSRIESEFSDHVNPPDEPEPLVCPPGQAVNPSTGLCEDVTPIEPEPEPDPPPHPPHPPPPP